METEVRQVYAGALQELVQQGERRMRHLPHSKRRSYERLKEQTFQTEARAARAPISQDQYLAVVDREYRELRQYWIGGDKLQIKPQLMNLYPYI